MPLLKCKYGTIALFIIGFLLFCIGNANALSRWVPLHEKVDESDLVIIGTVVKSGIIADYDEEKKRLTGDASESVERIEIKEILFGEENSREVFILQKMVISEEGMLLGTGDTAVLFLKKEAMKPKLQPNSRFLLDGKITDKFPEGPYYQPATVGKQSIELLASKGKAIEGKQKLVESIRIFCKTKEIKNTEERNKTWETLLKGSDPLLKENAKAELEKLGITEK